ncbi:MAG: TolC family protein [Melioribacteraceae bacterium]|nr:TolC family protein [Melioribacteraceae bacterium]
MKSFKIFFLMLLQISIINAQQISLSLQDAVNLALNNNSLIKQYEEKLKQKEFDYLASLGNFLPSLNFGLSYTHLNQNMKIDLNPIREVILNLQSTNQTELINLGNILSGKSPLNESQKSIVKTQAYNSLNEIIPQFKETFKKQDYRTGSFSIYQPIFMGGKLLAIKNASKNEKSAAYFELIKLKNEISYQTIDSYLKVILLKKAVKTRKDVLDGITKHKFKAQKLFEEGLIAKNNLLKAEVAQSEAERNYEKEKNNLSLAIESFKTIINSDKNIDINFVDSLTYHKSNYNFDSLKVIAKNTQPILKILDVKKNLSHNNYSILYSSFLPTIAAFGKYEIYPEYLSSLEPRWAIGLQLSYNLFNGFKDYLKLQSAKHLEDELTFAEKDINDKIELWLLNSYLEIKNKTNEFEKLSSSIELAVENLRQNEKRFETGLGTSLEVIDAHLTFEKIELEKFYTLYQYYLSVANLNLALGKPSDLFYVWNKQE